MLLLLHHGEDCGDLLHGHRPMRDDHLLQLLDGTNENLWRDRGQVGQIKPKLLQFGPPEEEPGGPGPVEEMAVVEEEESGGQAEDVQMEAGPSAEVAQPGQDEEQVYKNSEEVEEVEDDVEAEEPPIKEYRCEDCQFTTIQRPHDGSL